MALPTYGTMAVDWENRVDFDRLRRERLARAKEHLAKSEMGALLCFDMNNVRYLTATHIGTWAQDKANRFTLLPQNDEPILWDFGSAARHHQLHCPWLGERSRPGISMLRGAMTPEMGRAEDVAKKIRIELEMRGLHKEPVGIDIIELPVLFALQKEGIICEDIVAVVVQNFLKQSDRRLEFTALHPKVRFEPVHIVENRGRRRGRLEVSPFFLFQCLYSFKCFGGFVLV